MPVREKQTRRAGLGQHVPFSGPVQAHTPGKSRVFAAVGMEGTGETDWPAEESGFEPSVPPCERVGLSGRDANASQATRMVSNASSM